MKAAVYVLNRTPMKRIDWKTPFEVFMTATNGKETKPDIGNLYLFGSRAYIRIEGIPRKEKMLPRAQIGYLVGYEAHNIWRIWIPKDKKVIRARDCQFDETRQYDPDEPFISEIIKQDVPEYVSTVGQLDLKNINDINEEEDVFDAIDTAGNLVNANQQNIAQEVYQEADSAPTRSLVEAQAQHEKEAINNINGLLTPIPEERNEENMQQRETRPDKQDFTPQRQLTPESTNDNQDIGSHVLSSDLSPEASERYQIEDANRAEAEENDNLGPNSQSEETRGRIAPRDINLDLSESNITSEPRIRKPSRRALTSPTPQRKKRKEKRANFIQFKLQSYTVLHKSIQTAAIKTKLLHRNDLPLPLQN